jgi:hypothetical protein
MPEQRRKLEARNLQQIGASVFSPLRTAKPLENNKLLNRTAAEQFNFARRRLVKKPVEGRVNSEILISPAIEHSSCLFCAGRLSGCC